MKLKHWAVFIAALTLLLPAGDLKGDEIRAKEKRPVEKVEISNDDLEVIRSMELLSLMELLDDMELLEGEVKANSEDEK